MKSLRVSPRLGAIALGLALVSSFSGPVAAADPPAFWVNIKHGPWLPPGTSCDHPGYEHIQDAVTAAPPGTRINVCPGTYAEQVLVPAGKDNINLVSTSVWGAIIQAPQPVLVFPRAIVQITGAHNVGVVAFTITGPLIGGCDNNGYGVYVNGGGSANVLGNHITQIKDLSPTGQDLIGCQDGVAVRFGRASTGPGSGNIIGNVIDNYQKNGPTVSAMGSNARVIANRVMGMGPTNRIAQNGIQISFDATAQVSQNLVSNNNYTIPTDAATGILLYQSGVVTADRNTLTANNVGEYAFSTAAGSQTTNNTVRTSTYDGIAVDTDTSTVVANNSVVQNGGPGIGVYNGASNRLENNQIERNATNCAGTLAQCSVYAPIVTNAGGILLDKTQSNTVRQNHLRNNGTAGSPDNTDGLRVNSTATTNLIQSNFLFGNITHDCHDDSLGAGTAGTANIWTNDVGQTSHPAGLCQQSNNTGDDEDMQESPQGNDEDAEDRQASSQINSASGWDPAYRWYDGDPIAAQFDWPGAYSSVDTQSLLQLLATLNVGGGHPNVVAP